MSSKRAIRRRSCAGKDKFSSIEVAQSAAARAKRRGHVVVPYKCRFCGSIHIGHPSHEPGRQDNKRVHP